MSDCKNKIADNVKVIAQSRDVNSRKWSKLVQFNDYLGNEVRIPILCSSLAKEPQEVKAMLYDAGLDIPDEKGVIEYIKRSKSDKFYLSVDKTGWFKDCFVLPDCIIGDEENEVYFSEVSIDNTYKPKGTLKEWKDNIGAYCIGNSRLIFAVSSALAASLLYILDEENVGFHFVGNSSCGKSTILKVACSVWGDQNYMKTWRATDNAIEGIANLRNDTLLALDELGQIDPAKAGEVAYMLGNGQSKGRCNKNGSAKSISCWRLLYLSSGEKDLLDCGIESKKQVKAGQLIRLISIPVVHNENSYGAFDCLNGKKDGRELSEYLVSATKKTYGSVSREFINYLQKEGKIAVKEGYDKFKYEFINNNLPNDSDSQIQRAINKFAMVAYAGELATANGITGWKNGDAQSASIICFNDWIKYRGGTSNQEVNDIITQVKLFIEKYNDSRFRNLSSDTVRVINEMAGYKEEIEGGYQYLVMPNVFRDEICKCKGGRFRNIRNLLYKNGLLKSVDSEVRKIDGASIRCYTILPKVLE